jgi:hypothetical protein
MQPGVQTRLLIYRATQQKKMLGIAQNWVNDNNRRDNANYFSLEFSKIVYIIIVQCNINGWQEGAAAWPEGLLAVTITDHHLIDGGVENG